MSADVIRMLRVRYVIGLSVIACLVTATWYSMQTIISEQENHSARVNLAAGQQALSERIVLFATLMITATDDSDFTVARSQLNRAINAMQTNHEILTKGDPDGQLKLIMSPMLEIIYFDAMQGLERGLARYWENAKYIADSDRDALSMNSGPYLYLNQYGPHVLMPLLSSVAEEYERLGKEAIREIETLETILWLTTLFILCIEVVAIFRPLENRLRRAFDQLNLSNRELLTTAEELRSSRDESRAALAELQSTQEELVHAEKMASLGELVAGLAHEINTPAGIALTTASHVEEKTNQVMAKFDAGALRKSELKTFLHSLTQSAALLTSNVERASDLIQSFKQVASDRTSEQRREFLLKDYLGEVFLSLRPQFKRRPITITIHCADDLTLDSYPGPFAQVMSNLILNTLSHAFEPDQPGTITISVDQTIAHFVEITYHDDGRGIADEHIRRVFEPFFTTKRGQGGTGLGLHIVYNLVRETLGGSIAVASEAGDGVTFRLMLPIQAPQTATEDSADPVSPLSAAG